MNNGEKYKQLILASPLFSLDRERDRSAYQREALKMVDYLYRYLLAEDNRYEEYGLEITETANSCIDNYDPQNGEFFHYFNAAMAKAWRRAKTKRDMQEMRGGIHVAHEDDRSIRAVLNYMKRSEITHPTAEQIERIAEALNVTEQRVRDLLRMNAESVAISDTTQNDDGEEISLFDTIASDENIEQSVISADNCRVVLESIQTAYDGCQERQKPLLSALLTAKIATVVCQCEIPVANFTFVDKQLITEYIQTGTLPTQRELAARFGKNEASLSRTLKEFLGKIKT